MARRTSTLLTDERGATAIEYGLIISLIAIAALAAIIQVAGTTQLMWNGVSHRVTTSSDAARGSN